MLEGLLNASKASQHSDEKGPTVKPELVLTGSEEGKSKFQSLSPPHGTAVFRAVEYHCPITHVMTTGMMGLAAPTSSETSYGRKKPVNGKSA